MTSRFWPFDAIKFVLSAKTPAQLHSPYLFNLTRFIFDHERQYYAFESLEHERSALLRDKTPFTDPDLGAGPRKSKKGRRICDLARSTLSTPQRCHTLFRLVVYHQPVRTIEIGTSLGLSTAYLAAAHRQGDVIGLEGSAHCIETGRRIAQSHCLKNVTFVPGDFSNTLPGVLEQHKSFDLAIMDGNHRLDPTVAYFNLLRACASPRAIILVDDIRWSAEMYRAWTTIKSDQAVTASVDCYTFGMLFFNRDFKEKLELRVMPGKRSNLAALR